MKLFGLSIIVFFAANIFHGDSAQLVAQDNQPATKAPDEPSQQTIAKARELSQAFNQAAEHVLPAVVTVLGTSKDSNRSVLTKLDILDGDRRFDSVGSGVIIESDGLIVTNAHVVDDVTNALVRLADGREFQAGNIRMDKASDLAILRIECPTPLTIAEFGNSDKLLVGDWVLSIGSPFNFEQTVSAGIISGKARRIENGGKGQFLQTDAAVNPGNSGGALVNLDGELIGINTAISSTSGFFQGVGFAIPINRVKWVVSELKERGEVRRASLGIRIDPLPQVIADELKLPVRGGLYVTRVTPNKPAANAGLQVGDVVLELASQKVRSPADFATIVEQLSVGMPHPIVILRDGKRMELTVTPIQREAEATPEPAKE